MVRIRPSRGCGEPHPVDRPATQRTRREAEAAAAEDEAAARDWRPSTGKQCCDYDLDGDEVGGPLVDRPARDDGPWTDVLDAARGRGGAGAPPVEVALVALVAEALAPADAWPGLFSRAGI